MLNGLIAQLGIQVGEPYGVVGLGTIGILLEAFAPFFNGLINLMPFDRTGKGLGHGADNQDATAIFAVASLVVEGGTAIWAPHTFNH